MNKMVVKNGLDLASDELNQMNVSLGREFKGVKLKAEELENGLFFLLKEGEEILAMGGLLKVKPVLFNGEEFTIYGVIEVIANKKGKGYGRQIVSKMRDYLIKNNLTGLGFCMPKIKGFYEKCGFKIDTTSVQRFVYTKNGERITNQDDQIIFFQDSSDQFMEKVLTNKDQEISIPTDGLW